MNPQDQCTRREAPLASCRWRTPMAQGRRPIHGDHVRPRELSTQKMFQTAGNLPAALEAHIWKILGRVPG